MVLVQSLHFVPGGVFSGLSEGGVGPGFLSISPARSRSLRGSYAGVMPSHIKNPTPCGVGRLMVLKVVLCWKVGF